MSHVDDMQEILNQIYKVVAEVTYLPHVPKLPPVGPAPLILSPGSLEQTFGPFFQIAASPEAQNAVSARAMGAADIVNRHALVELEVARQKLGDWTGGAAGAYVERFVRLQSAVRLTVDELRTLSAFVKAAASIYEQTWKSALEIAQTALEGFRNEGQQRTSIYVDLAKDAITIMGDAAGARQSGGGPVFADLAITAIDGVELFITADDVVGVFHEMLKATDDLGKLTDQAVGALTNDLDRHLQQMTGPDRSVFMPSLPA
jgi:hypothetical protein